MQKIKNIFHKVSYLQYFFFALGLYFMFLFYYSVFTKESIESSFAHLNTVLILFGVGISFSTLQDTTKTQNKLSKRIWESNKKGKIALIMMSLTVLIFFAMGMFGYFSEVWLLREVSVGLIMLGIGCMGLLKAAAEMYDIHRKDR